MKVLLTGAAGRIGSQVCRALVEAGHFVRATDLVDRTDLPVPIAVADLLAREASYRLLEGIEAVVHLGNHAFMHGPDRQKVFNENTTMNMNVFQAAAELKVAHVVFASSVQVISGGPPYDHATPAFPYLPLDGQTPPSPGNAYGLSKQVSEVMLEYFARRYGMTATLVRFPFVVVDDHQRAWIRNDPRQFVSGCREAFTCLHLLDAAALVLAILEANLTGYRIYFPSSLDNRTGLPTAEVIRQHYAGIALRRPLEEITSLGDNATIERDTGWIPRHNAMG